MSLKKTLFATIAIATSSYGHTASNPFPGATPLRPFPPMRGDFNRNPYPALKAMEYAQTVDTAVERILDKLGSPKDAATQAIVRKEIFNLLALLNLDNHLQRPTPRQLGEFLRQPLNDPMFPLDD